MTRMAKNTANGNGGSKWCRRDLRLGIYLRDGMACAWCGATVEDGAILTLDHCRVRSRGGDNSPANLITSCRRCNSARSDRPMAAFARAVADYLDHGITAAEILAHVRRCRARLVPRQEAKKMIARRGSYAQALNRAAERAAG